jgi:heme/copper-type cytochrome/quinol oxidase subunit 2
MSTRLTSRWPRTAAVLAIALAVAAGALVHAQNRRSFTVTAYKYGYKVSGTDTAEIHVQQGDMVHIEFSTDDIPHSFTIDDDHYRISRRAAPGKPATFDFLADKPGRFRIHCTLTIDPQCKTMEAWLVVDPRK